MTTICRKKEMPTDEVQMTDRERFKIVLIDMTNLSSLFLPNSFWMNCKILQIVPHIDASIMKCKGYKNVM